MKFNEIIKSMTSDILKGISRFTASFAITLALFLLQSYCIIVDYQVTIVKELIFALAMGLFFSVLFVLICERVKTKINKVIPSILSVVPIVICYLTAHIMGYSSEYFIMGYYGIIIALVCFIMCLLFTDENSLLLVPHIVKSIFFTGIICAVISVGISICIAAVQNLVFNFNDFYKVYFIVNLFIWLVMFVNIFLSYLPKKDEQIVIPKLFKTIVVNAALPVYILLMIILYVYLVKIIITRNMPVGQINWFASFASLLFVFFAFSVRQYKDKLPAVFTKLIGFFIIPVVIMQLVAIYERVSAYGLTTPRIISLILVAISIIFAVFSILGKKLEHVFWAVGIITLIFTLIPSINVIDLPKKSQISLLESYLNKNGMLEGGTIIKNNNVSDYDKERIVSAYNYLWDAAGKKPQWIEKSEGNNAYEIFGFDYETTKNTFSYYMSEDKYIDISDYIGMQNITFYDNDSVKISVNEREVSVDPYTLFRDLYDKYGSECEDIDPILIDDGVYLYIVSADAGFTDNMSGIDNCYLNGYIFCK